MKNEDVHGIEIIQILKNGILGTDRTVYLNRNVDGYNFDIQIIENGIRSIKILSVREAPIRLLWSEFCLLESLLMLGTGIFLDIFEQHHIVNGKREHSDELDYLVNNRVSYYKSGEVSYLPFKKMLSNEYLASEEKIIIWENIRAELDIIHPMIMYCLSDIKLPIDCKCALMIEAMEPLAELVGKNSNEFKCPEDKKQQLKVRLKALICTYGEDIFSKEYERKEEFIQVLVNSRNRIAHIRSENDRMVLNGEESALYLMKLSLFYRRIILTTIGVEYKMYSSILKEEIRQLDTWNGISDNFIDKLNERFNK